MPPVDLRSHLGSLPPDLAEALEDTYRSTMDHYLQGEWGDAQVDAGRFCEAALRHLEWRMSNSYTPIDGKSRPNRKVTVGKATKDVTLPPSLRAQVPTSIELMMDFRNNRNSAHLGNIDANRMDASCVVQNATWVLGEIMRLETQQSPTTVQRLIDQLAERHIPLVQKVNGRPIVLNAKLAAGDKALVLLYQWSEPVDIQTLREWAGYGNASRWRNQVIPKLQKQSLVHVEANLVTLLIPGEAHAQQIVLEAGGL